MQIENGNIIMQPCTCGPGDRTSRCLSPCTEQKIERIQAGPQRKDFDALHKMLDELNDLPPSRLPSKVTEIRGLISYLSVLTDLWRDLHNARLDMAEGALATEFEHDEGEEIERAIAWAWGEAAVMLDDGKDPRQFGSAVVAQQYKKELERGNVARENLTQEARAARHWQEQSDEHATMGEDLKRLSAGPNHGGASQTMLINIAKSLHKQIGKERQRIARLERQIKALHDSSGLDVQHRFDKKIGSGERL